MNKTALISVSTVISSASLAAVGVNPAIAQSPTLASLSAGITAPQPSSNLHALNTRLLAETKRSHNDIQDFSQSSSATLIASQSLSSTLTTLGDNTGWQSDAQDFSQSSPATLVASQSSPTTLVALENDTSWQAGATSDFSQSPSTTLVALGDNTSWQTSAAHLRNKLDQDSVFECPARGQLGPVWGSGVYSDESSVCSAAVHAGVINANQGGTVTIRTRPAQTAYAGSERNGVITQESGSGQGSFVFLSSEMPIDEPIGWEYGVSDLRGRLDQSFTFTCMPNGTIHNVWGSDLYTDDSSVCSAAVHSGLINTREGGTVSVRMISGQGAYTGTSRNGVSTIGYGNWHGSYIFLR